MLQSVFVFGWEKQTETKKVYEGKKRNEVSGMQWGEQQKKENQGREGEKEILSALLRLLCTFHAHCFQHATCPVSSLLLVVVHLLLVVLFSTDF